MVTRGLTTGRAAYAALGAVLAIACSGPGDGADGFTGAASGGTGVGGRGNTSSSHGGRTSGGATSTGGTSSEGGAAASGVVPVMWITTPSVSDPSTLGESDVTGTVRIVEQHDGSHSNPSTFATLPATLEASMALHVRGSSSTGFPKKSFALELRDSAGADLKLPVLGMPKESDWVLHGPYSDKTYLRNALAYWAGREFYRRADGTIEPGRWNPRTHFTELYLNGQYWGVYVVVEKVKADADRVDVDRPAASRADGDVSGGYIVRREGSGDPAEGRDWVSTVDHTVYTQHYPKTEDLTDDQRDYIHGYFDDFEAMMNDDDWADAASGYPAWIELTSWLDYALAQEWSNNVDAYFKSVYFVKQVDTRGGKLSLSPLWDFDLAFGNADYRNGSDASNWVHLMQGSESTSYDPPGQVPYLTPYFAKLWTDPAFVLALRCRWESLRKGALETAAVHAQIDAWSAYLAPAERRDHQRWPVIGKKVWPNSFIGKTYAEEVSYLERFVDERFEFLDEQLPVLAPGTCK